MKAHSFLCRRYASNFVRQLVVGSEVWRRLLWTDDDRCLVATLAASCCIVLFGFGLVFNSGFFTGLRI